MRMVLTVTDGCFGAGVASLLDILATAELLRTEVDAALPAFEVVVAASRRKVHASNGMSVPVTATLRDVEQADVVIVPGLGTTTGRDTLDAVATPDGLALVRALRGLNPEGCRVATACTGSFALAASGHLDGRNATTTWECAPAFRAAYPKVRVDLASMMVGDGPFLTAGAAFAHIDLGLALVRAVSADLARRVARSMLIDQRPSQAGFVALEHLAHDDDLVLAFERHVRANLAEPFDVLKTATALGTSRRTLERRTQQILGTSPLGLVRRLRLERAAHLRRTTDLSTAEIAHRVGYANAETLRALRRELDPST